MRWFWKSTAMFVMVAFLGSQLPQKGEAYFLPRQMLAPRAQVTLPQTEIAADWTPEQTIQIYEAQIALLKKQLIQNHYFSPLFKKIVQLEWSYKEAPFNQAGLAPAIRELKIRFEQFQSQLNQSLKKVKSSSKAHLIFKNYLTQLERTHETVLNWMCVYAEKSWMKDRAPDINLFHFVRTQAAHAREKWNNKKLPDSLEELHQQMNQEVKKALKKLDFEQSVYLTVLLDSKPEKKEAKLESLLKAAFANRGAPALIQSAIQQIKDEMLIQNRFLEKFKTLGLDTGSARKALHQIAAKELGKDFRKIERDKIIKQFMIVAAVIFGLIVAVLNFIPFFKNQKITPIQETPISQSESPQPSQEESALRIEIKQRREEDVNKQAVVLSQDEKQKLFDSLFQPVQKKTISSPKTVSTPKQKKEIQQLRKEVDLLKTALKNQGSEEAKKIKIKTHALQEKIAQLKKETKQEKEKAAQATQQIRGEIIKKYPKLNPKEIKTKKSKKKVQQWHKPKQKREPPQARKTASRSPFAKSDTYQAEQGGGSPASQIEVARIVAANGRPVTSRYLVEGVAHQLNPETMTYAFQNSKRREWLLKLFDAQPVEWVEYDDVKQTYVQVMIPPNHVIETLETSNPVQAFKLFYDLLNGKWFLKTDQPPGQLRIGIRPGQVMLKVWRLVRVPISQRKIPMLQILGTPLEKLFPKKVLRLIALSLSFSPQKQDEIRRELMSYFYYSTNPLIKQFYQPEKMKDYFQTDPELKRYYEEEIAPYTKDKISRFKLSWAFGVHKCDVATANNLSIAKLMGREMEAQKGYFDANPPDHRFTTAEAHMWGNTRQIEESTAGCAIDPTWMRQVDQKGYEQSLELIKQHTLLFHKNIDHLLKRLEEEVKLEKEKTKLAEIEQKTKALQQKLEEQENQLAEKEMALAGKKDPAVEYEEAQQAYQGKSEQASQLIQTLAYEYQKNPAQTISQIEELIQKLSTYPLEPAPTRYDLMAAGEFVLKSLHQIETLLPQFKNKTGPAKVIIFNTIKLLPILRGHNWDLFESHRGLLSHLHPQRFQYNNLLLKQEGGKVYAIDILKNKKWEMPKDQFKVINYSQGILKVLVEGERINKIGPGGLKLNLKQNNYRLYGGKVNKYQGERFSAVIIPNYIAPIQSSPILGWVRNQFFFLEKNQFKILHQYSHSFQQPRLQNMQEANQYLDQKYQKQMNRTNTMQTWILRDGKKITVVKNKDQTASYIGFGTEKIKGNHFPFATAPFETPDGWVAITREENAPYFKIIGPGALKIKLEKRKISLHAEELRKVINRGDPREVIRNFKIHEGEWAFLYSGLSRSMKLSSLSSGKEQKMHGRSGLFSDGTEFYLKVVEYSFNGTAARKHILPFLNKHSIQNSFDSMFFSLKKSDFNSWLILFRKNGKDLFIGTYAEQEIFPWLVRYPVDRKQFKFVHDFHRFKSGEWVAGLRNDLGEIRFIGSWAEKRNLHQKTFPQGFLLEIQRGSRDGCERDIVLMYQEGEGKEWKWESSIPGLQMVQANPKRGFISNVPFSTAELYQNGEARVKVTYQGNTFIFETGMNYLQRMTALYAIPDAAAMKEIREDRFDEQFKQLLLIPKTDPQLKPILKAVLREMLIKEQSDFFDYTPLLEFIFKNRPLFFQAVSELAVPEIQKLIHLFQGTWIGTNLRWELVGKYLEQSSENKEAEKLLLQLFNEPTRVQQWLLQKDKLNIPSLQKAIDLYDTKQILKVIEQYKTEILKIICFSSSGMVGKMYHSSPALVGYKQDQFVFDLLLDNIKNKEKVKSIFKETPLEPAIEWGIYNEVSDQKIKKDEKREIVLKLVQRLGRFPYPKIFAAKYVLEKMLNTQDVILDILPQLNDEDLFHFLGYLNYTIHLKVFDSQTSRHDLLLTLKEKRKVQIFLLRLLLQANLNPDKVQALSQSYNLTPAWFEQAILSYENQCYEECFGVDKKQAQTLYLFPFFYVNKQVKTIKQINRLMETTLTDIEQMQYKRYRVQMQQLEKQIEKLKIKFNKKNFNHNKLTFIYQYLHQTLKEETGMEGVPFNTQLHPSEKKSLTYRLILKLRQFPQVLKIRSPKTKQLKKHEALWQKINRKLTSILGETWSGDQRFSGSLMKEFLQNSYLWLILMLFLQHLLGMTAHKDRLLAWRSYIVCGGLLVSAPALWFFFGFSQLFALFFGMAAVNMGLFYYAYQGQSAKETARQILNAAVTEDKWEGTKEEIKQKIQDALFSKQGGKNLKLVYPLLNQKEKRALTATLLLALGVTRDQDRQLVYGSKKKLAFKIVLLIEAIFLTGLTWFVLDWVFAAVPFAGAIAAIMVLGGIFGISYLLVRPPKPFRQRQAHNQELKQWALFDRTQETLDVYYEELSRILAETQKGKVEQKKEQLVSEPQKTLPSWDEIRQRIMALFSASKEPLSSKDRLIQSLHGNGIPRMQRSEEGEEYYGNRPYVFGDDRRKIDNKQSGRRVDSFGDIDYVVKVMQQEKSINKNLILDLRTLKEPALIETWMKELAFVFSQCQQCQDFQVDHLLFILPNGEVGIEKLQMHEGITVNRFLGRFLNVFHQYYQYAEKMEMQKELASKIKDLLAQIDAKRNFYSEEENKTYAQAFDFAVQLMAENIQLNPIQELEKKIQGLPGSKRANYLLIGIHPEDKEVLTARLKQFKLNVIAPSVKKEGSTLSVSAVWLYVAALALFYPSACLLKSVLLGLGILVSFQLMRQTQLRKSQTLQQEKYIIAAYERFHLKQKKALHASCFERLTPSPVACFL